MGRSSGRKQHVAVYSQHVYARLSSRPRGRTFWCPARRIPDERIYHLDCYRLGHFCTRTPFIPFYFGHRCVWSAESVQLFHRCGRIRRANFQRQRQQVGIVKQTTFRVGGGWTWWTQGHVFGRIGYDFSARKGFRSVRIHRCGTVVRATRQCSQSRNRSEQEKRSGDRGWTKQGHAAKFLSITAV